VKRFIILMFSLFIAGSAVAAEASGPMLISIDSPAFRKLVIATPAIQAVGTINDAQGKKLIEEGSQELSRLLVFSGFFAPLADGAYAGAWSQFTASRKTKESTAWVSDSKGLTGEEYVLWRALGVEALTVGALTEEPGKGLVLSFKTIDVSRGKEILAKQFTRITDYKATIRQYADYLLEAYTGKSGIFNSRIVFVARKSKGSQKQIYMSDFDGSNVQAITEGEYPHLSPSWSPDGRYIAFTSYEFKNPELFIYDTQTRIKKRLTNNLGLDSGANFSADGKWIAYTSSRGDDTDIFMTSPQGIGKKLLLEGSGLDVDPKFSPDGKHIAFVSGRFGNPHIFVAGLEKGDTPKVNGDKRLTYAGWYNATPNWSPDSDKIVFAGYDKDINRWDAFLMNPDGSQLERLTLKNGDNESPSFSPNGQLIAFQSNRVGDGNGKAQGNLWIMNRDGSNQHKLTVPGFYDIAAPMWSSNRRDRQD
jgi:TolB protein